MDYFSSIVRQPVVSYGLLTLEVSRSHCDTPYIRQDSSGRVISQTQRTLPDNTQHSQQTDRHSPGGIQSHNPSKRVASDNALDQTNIGMVCLVTDLFIYSFYLFNTFKQFIYFGLLIVLYAANLCFVQLQCICVLSSGICVLRMCSVNPCSCLFFYLCVYIYIYTYIFISIKLDFVTTTWRVLNRTVFKYGTTMNKQSGTADNGRSTSLNI